MPTTTASIAESVNAFAAELHQRLGRGGGDLVFSPLAIHSALAMVYAGARRKTARKLAKRLGLPVDQDELPGPYGTLIRLLDGTTGPQWKLASALWGRRGLGFNEGFRGTLGNDYGADLIEADFADGPGTARAVNAWVASRTGGRIDGLASHDLFTALSMFVLTSAIYFKDAWLSPFDAGETAEAEFRTERGRRAGLPMMHLSEYFGYAETRDVQVVSLPYRNADASMLIVLPWEDHGLRAFERNLSAADIEAAVRQLARQKVNLHLPRFRVHRTLGLREALSGMGMRVVFDPQEADFSGIADVQPLWLDEALHRAYVDVNEEGTEAAAATVLGGRGGYTPDVPVEFRADHPFLFLIRHEPTGAFVFMGRFTGD